MSREMKHLIPVVLWIDCARLLLLSFFPIRAVSAEIYGWRVAHGMIELGTWKQN
uniref:Uncharacterized protein n=1 Tax=Manihot esculenta TaxID=3983 RepID=A0A2C9W9K0_MANES